MDINNLTNDFIKLYGNRSNIQTFFAPGRVNIIGEHTDYNGGHVFPCALSFGTFAIASKRNDSSIYLYSKNFPLFGVIKTDINNLVYDKNHDWANYPKGVVKVFKDEGYDMHKGFNILYFGNIPNGAGLSSSASIELVTSITLKHLYNLELDMIEMVKLSQRAENEFVGVNCGIMDQFASGMGKSNHGILINTRTLNYQYAPMKLEGITIVIANTNKRRGLTDSKYNERRGQCESALKKLRYKLSISSLCDLSEEDFEEHKYLITDEVQKKRARHAVYENQRTIKAFAALNNNDIRLFGELINQSHISLRDDYEVSSEELNTLVEAAWSFGVLGARMTGAGFGGCTVNLVEDRKVNEFIDKVGKVYREKIGYNADFYVASIGDGAKEVKR
jgi:galactokinase